MKKVLLLHGPNLDMLGIREPDVYGHDTLAALEAEIREYAAQRGFELSCFQSNSEGELIDTIHEAHTVFDGIVYNPGAHTHYSYALRDAIASIATPVVEVHLSDISMRENFRRVSVIAPVCIAQIKGKGKAGYKEALDLLLDYERHASETAAREAALEACLEAAATQTADGAAASASRIEKLRARTAELGADAFYVRDNSNLRWLTAFDQVFDSEDAHAMLVEPHAVSLHTDTRYEEAFHRAVASRQGDIEIGIDAAQGSHAAFAVRRLGTSSAAASTAAAADADPAAQAGTADVPAAQTSASTAPRTLAIERSLSLAEYRSLEQVAKEAQIALVETSDEIIALRAVKDAGEIARMKAAQVITDAAFAHIITYIRPGMTEREVQIELEDYMFRHGAEGLAFSSIVACGSNGASPHAIPGATRLEAGQCVVLDFGARALGYCSDMTRMVFLGQPSEEMRAAYETIRRANETVAARIRPGVTGAEMHQLAEDILAEGGFAGKMGHGLGHGVGIDVHEEPRLSLRNTQPLQAGNVVTVEPGIYLAGEFGMRLEDFGVVTADGFEVFTRSSHEIVII